MKLYYSPGSCALSPHIVLNELQMDYSLEKVDLKTHKTEKDQDYMTINPKGYVPALQLDDGEILTEGPAIVQYLADQKPSAGLLPPAGTVDRAHVQAWLNFIGTELHKNFGPLFRSHSEDWKTAARQNIERRLAYVEEVLADRDYLLGDAFSVADPYLFTVLNWAEPMNIDISALKAVTAYHRRIASRPSAQKAMKEQGLI